MRQLHNKNITNYLKNSIYNYDISKKNYILHSTTAYYNLKHKNYFFSPIPNA